MYICINQAGCMAGVVGCVGGYGDVYMLFYEISIK